MSEYPSDYCPQTVSVMAFNTPTRVNREAPTPDHSQANLAKLTYRKLVECLFHFENSLEDNHEVGVRLTSFAPDEAFYIKDVGYCDPHMIIFAGESKNGEKLQLIQHVSQLSVCFISLETRGEEPVRVGFQLKRAAEKGK